MFVENRMTSLAISDFVPADLDASKWENLEPLFAELNGRGVNTAGEFERWLLDRSELDATISEAAAVRFIDMTCDTASDSKKQSYMNFVEQVVPQVKPASFELDKKQAALAKRFDLGTRYAVINRDTIGAVELFREQNVPIETELTRLDTEYDTVCGAMMVKFDGEEKTLPQMGKYQESADRSVREAAWKVVAERRAQDAEKISGLFDQMVAKRHLLSVNAGFKDFVGYSFKAKRRFDYTPAHCFAFHDGIEKHVMPFVAPPGRGTQEAPEDRLAEALGCHRRPQGPRPPQALHRRRGPGRQDPACVRPAQPRAGHHVPLAG
jgi:oligoendopeptidase F